MVQSVLDICFVMFSPDYFFAKQNCLFYIFPFTELRPFSPITSSRSISNLHKRGTLNKDLDGGETSDKRSPEISHTKKKASLLPLFLQSLHIGYVEYTQYGKIRLDSADRPTLRQKNKSHYKREVIKKEKMAPLRLSISMSLLACVLLLYLALAPTTFVLAAPAYERVSRFAAFRIQRRLPDAPPPYGNGTDPGIGVDVGVGVGVRDGGGSAAPTGGPGGGSGWAGPAGPGGDGGGGGGGGGDGDGGDEELPVPSITIISGGTRIMPSDAWFEGP